MATWRLEASADRPAWWDSSCCDESARAERAEDGDLSQSARVLVPEADYNRAHGLFYVEREDEL